MDLHYYRDYDYKEISRAMNISVVRGRRAPLPWTPTPSSTNREQTNEENPMTCIDFIIVYVQWLDAGQTPPLSESALQHQSTCFRCSTLSRRMLENDARFKREVLPEIDIRRMSDRLIAAYKPMKISLPFSAALRFSYLATWLPNARLALGDVGVLQGEEFRQMTTLKQLGVPFVIRRGAASIDFNYTSASGVALQLKAKGKIAAGTSLPLAKAGIAVRFSKQGAFVFQVAGSKIHEIEDKAGVHRAIIGLYEQGRWQPGWAVVDTVVEADATTIMVANSNDAVIELAANAPVQVTDLVRLDAGFAVSSQSGDVIRFVAAKGLTPLFRLSRTKASLLSRLVGGSKAIVFGGPGQSAKLLRRPRWKKYSRWWHPSLERRRDAHLTRRFSPSQ